MEKWTNLPTNNFELFINSHCSDATVAVGMVGQWRQNKLERSLRLPRKYALTEIVGSKQSSAKPKGHQMPLTVKHPDPTGATQQAGVIAGKELLDRLDTKVLYVRLIGDYPTGWDGKVKIRCATPGTLKNVVSFEADFYKGSRALAVAGATRTKYCHYRPSNVWFGSFEEMLYLQGFGEMTLESLAPLQQSWT